MEACLKPHSVHTSCFLSALCVHTLGLRPKSGQTSCFSRLRPKIGQTSCFFSLQLQELEHFVLNTLGLRPEIGQTSCFSRTQLQELEHSVLTRFGVSSHGHDAGFSSSYSCKCAQRGQTTDSPMSGRCAASLAYFPIIPLLEGCLARPPRRRTRLTNTPRH